MIGRWLVLALALGCGGCRAAPSPEATLAAYLGALSAGRLDEAYGLLSSDYRRTHDRQAFAREVARGAGAAGRVRSARVALRAEAELPDGDRLPLVFEDGAWRIARDPLDFYPQHTPEEALRSFVRAVENRRYDVVLRFVPARYRATITVDKLRERWEGGARDELYAELQSVRAHLGEPVEASGDEARLTVGERKQARLVLEDGAWKVESLE
jgi:hypothetical protein